MWRILILADHTPEPLEYIACTRCRRSLRELAEIAFGDSLSGLFEFRGDVPY